MLTIYGQRHRFCDGISRRNFLKIGALGLGGLALPQLLQAETQAGIGKSHKAIIMIYLPGGPPHQDMFDLKLDAPSEIRGEFKPIKTNVPGIQICEHLPRMAAMMDKLVPIRSIVGMIDEHTDFHCMTGHISRNQPPGGWPSFGSVISKLQGATDPAIPAYIGLEPKMQHRPYNAASSGFLGVAHRSFHPEGDAKTDMTLNGITLDRLADRKSLLTSFDQFRRDAGARVVTCAFGFWDYHGNNFQNARTCLPMLDEGVSALVEDLHQRGLDKDVSVIVWGEFGRTP